jgi:cytochrome c biogenesis protein CcmG, thiol:disulfide interchange protein DsbE
MTRRSVLLTWSLAAVLVLVMALSACSKKKEAKAPEPSAGNVSIESVSMAPDVTLRAADGSTVKLQSYQGKIVFLNFFATWNGDSRQEIPILNNLAAEFARYDVVVLGVAIDTNGPGALSAFLDTNPVKYPVFYNGSEVVPKFGGVRKLPATIILARDGRIFKRALGLQTGRDFEDTIHEIMGQRL